MAQASLRAFEVRLKRVEDSVRRLLAEKNRQARIAASASAGGATGGGSGTSQGYVHKQLLATDTWVIDHNLGRYPAVTVVDSIKRVYEGDVVYVSENRVRIIFAAPFSGEAYLT